jgi:hypothetical protein
MIHSIKCRICTCRMTAVRLAQPDRDAKDLYAQKVCREFVTRPISNHDGITQRFFELARRFVSEVRSVHKYVTD